jgi:hypothetical protein
VLVLLYARSHPRGKQFPGSFRQLASTPPRTASNRPSTQVVPADCCNVSLVFPECYAAKAHDPLLRHGPPPRRPPEPDEGGVLPAVRMVLMAGAGQQPAAAMPPPAEKEPGPYHVRQGGRP